MQDRNSFLSVPSDVLGTIGSFVGVEGIVNVLCTNRELLSRRDYVMSSVVNGMSREESFSVFSELVVNCNINAVKWFRCKDGSDVDDAPFLKKSLNERDKNGGCWQIGGALHVATYYGHRALVDQLLTMGAEINTVGEWGATALHWAALRGQKEVTEILLDRGANLGAKDNDGDTALIWAAVAGQKEVAEILLDRGADGNTALIRAAVAGQKEVAEILLDRGADLEAKDCDGRTALLLAAKRGRKEMTEMLLDRGANWKTKDHGRSALYDYGRTALDIATRHGRDEIATLIRNRRAKKARYKKGSRAKREAREALWKDSSNNDYKV